MQSGAGLTVRCEAGRTCLSSRTPHSRLKGQISTNAGRGDSS